MPDRNESNGAAAAAILAAGIGSLVLGLVVVLAEACEPVKVALTFSKAVGPLSGKTTVALASWGIGWGMLHALWGHRTVPFQKVFLFALVAIALGLLMSFPPFYLLFERAWRA